MHSYLIVWYNGNEYQFSYIKSDEPPYDMASVRLAHVMAQRAQSIDITEDDVYLIVPIPEETFVLMHEDKVPVPVYQLKIDSK